MAEHEPEWKGPLGLMVRLGVPPTRENYLDFIYGGEPPAKLTHEMEADLPPQFRVNQPQR